MTIPHTIARKLWIPLLALIVGVPVLSWILHADFVNSFPSLFLTLTLFGQLTGIVGAQLFAFALLLSARLKMMEFFFGGLDKLYDIHHKVGTIAFVFLAVHPLLLAFRYIEDGMGEVMHFLMPFTNDAKDFGIYALLLMLTLLFITFYGIVFSYGALKKMHQFMGLAFFLGALHIYLIPSSLSSDIVLKVSCLSMAFIGCAAYTYRTLLGNFLVHRYPYVVSGVQKIGESITEVTLSPTAESMTHLPGQFMLLSFVKAGAIPDEEHPFSISSAFGNGTIRFSAKALGDYTKLLPTLKVGARAKVEGPFGDFTFSNGSKTQVWVAGGIGVTPFVGMAEYFLNQDTMDYTVDFYYSVKTESEGAYRELFIKLQEKHKNFTFHFMPSDTAGYITGELLKKEIENLKEKDIFVCGPPPMMSALKKSLLSLGISRSKIHSESFALLK